MNNKALYLIICFFINYVFQLQLILASALPNLESTPEQTTQNIPAYLFLTEVNFKNSKHDFLKFKVLSRNGQTTVNLKGLEFYDDKIFKTVSSDFVIPSESEVTLTFDQNHPDDPGHGQLYTEHTGLTSTTEQIILQQNGNYFDFFCWQKAPITSTEIKDFQKIFRSDFWNDSDPLSCFDSNQVEKDQSVFRLNKEFDSEAWTTGATQEKSDPSASSSETESGVEPINNSQQQADVSLLSLPDQEINQLFSPPPQTKTTRKASSKSASSSKSIPDLPAETEVISDSPLEITEIFPAPPSGSPEWIEVHNKSSQEVDLKNWILDDADGGSKPFRLASQILNPQAFLVLDSKQTKLNLNNSADQVRLFTPDLQLADQIPYDESTKNQSYAKILTDGQPEWIWTDEITSGQSNPVYQTLSGKISQEAQFDDAYYFEIETEEQQRIKIYFDEKTVKAPLARTLFTKGSGGKFIVETAADKSFHLKKYQLENQSPAQENNSLPIIIGVTILAGSGGFFLLKNKLRWKILTSS